MSYIPSTNFFLILFREFLNTFIHSSGDDPLLARAHRLIQPEPAQSKNILLLLPIGLGLVLNILVSVEQIVNVLHANKSQIRYFIGHVLMPLLILETVAVEKQANASELGAKKLAPLSRHLFRTIAILYRTGGLGLGLLLNGIGSACSYWAMHSSAAKLLTALLPSPVANIIASILLAETRFLWTARTILPHDQMRFVSTSHDRVRWKALVLPTIVYAAAETVMVHVPALFDDGLTLPQEQITIAGLSQIVRSDVLISGLMLAAQLFFLFPSHIMLILAQASLLPPNCETRVFSPSRQQHRGMRVGEIFSGVSRVPLLLSEAVQVIGVGRVLYCFELHGKMCFSLVVVTAMVHSVVYTML